MTQTFYKAVDGITDGMSYHTRDVVFPGTESLNAHYERTSGRDGDRVLYVKASKSDYDTYRESLAPSGDGTPSGVVGFGATGLVSGSQMTAAGDPVKADAATAKPTEGEPVPATADESQRRLLAAADGTQGVDGVAETKSAPKPSPLSK